MEMKCLAVLGASGHGKVAADAALLVGWESVVFFDDAWPTRSSIGPWPVVGDTDKLLLNREMYSAAVVAIGNNSIRLSKLKLLADAGLRIAGIVHPGAVVSAFAEIGHGSFVAAGAVINAFARIGAGCIINTGATVDHDCFLSEGVHVSPGAHVGGNVYVGRATWIGIGASVRQCVRIGENVMIGAGSSVVGDVEPDLTVVGVPARNITYYKKNA